MKCHFKLIHLAWKLKCFNNIEMSHKRPKPHIILHYFGLTFPILNIKPSW